MALVAVECSLCDFKEWREDGKPLPPCYNCLSPMRMSETEVDVSDEDQHLIEEMVENFFEDLEYDFGMGEDDDD